MAVARHQTSTLFPTRRSSDLDENRNEEQQAVARARRVWLTVLRDAVQRERHSSDRAAARAADHERGERREPPPVEREPRGGGGNADRDTAARVREQDDEHTGED